MPKMTDSGLRRVRPWQMDRVTNDIKGFGLRYKSERYSSVGRAMKRFRVTTAIGIEYEDLETYIGRRFESVYRSQL